MDISQDTIPHCLVHELARARANRSSANLALAD